jgi:hypothetical protein
METLSSEPSHDIEFQENNELVYDTCISEAHEENEEGIVFLDSLESQDHIFVESYEGSICVAPITCDVVSFCYTYKSLTSIMSHSHCHKCFKCHKYLILFM